MTNSNGDQDGREIWFLNRDLVVLRPRQPFLDWVRETDPREPVPEDEVRSSVNAFLIPEFDTAREARSWVREQFETLFEIELNDWYTEPSMWPETRDWEMFLQWFEIEYVGTAWDLVDAPLSSDPPVP